MSDRIIDCDGFYCVSNAHVYDLDESLIASGYPMRTVLNIPAIPIAEEKDFKRGTNLNKATLNTGNQGHNQFMSGVRVAFDLTFSNKAWVEAERYRFLTFVSSQSTMHRITRFDVDKQYNKYVDSRIIEIMKEKVKEYNTLLESDHIEDDLPSKYLEILYSNPAGFELTARMSTNYRCLQNIYIQRHNHRLPEWREFCSWIATLPYFNELIAGGKSLVDIT